MANLKAVLETLDELPDAQHELYTNKDGKFYLNVEAFEEHPSVVGMRNAFNAQKVLAQKRLDELTKLKERLAKIPEDFDPEQYEALKVKLEEYEQDPAKRQPATDKERQEAIAARKMLEQKIASMEKAHAAEIAKLNGTLQKKDSYIAKLVIDGGLTRALINANVTKEFLPAVKALLRPNFKVVEENEDYAAVSETDAGPLDIDQFVGNWASSDEGKSFIPPAKGADAGGGTGKLPKGDGAVKNPWSKEHWNLTEQGKILKSDRSRAERLAKAVGEKLPAPL